MIGKGEGFPAAAVHQSAMARHPLVRINHFHFMGLLITEPAAVLPLSQLEERLAAAPFIPKQLTGFNSVFVFEDAAPGQ